MRTIPFGERWRMERPLARPHEVPRIGFFELGIGGFGKLEPLLRTLAAAYIHHDGGHEIEIVRVEPQDPQKPGEAREVAVDDLLQITHPSAAPILEALRREQVHAEQDIDGGYDLAAREYLLRSAHDSRVERVVTKRVDAQCRH